MKQSYNETIEYVLMNKKSHFLFACMNAQDTTAVETE